VYTQSLDQERQRLRQALLDDLKPYVAEINQWSKIGYVYVFDQAGTMIAHPEITDSEAQRSKDLINPDTGNPIYMDLKRAAAENRPLEYHWYGPRGQREKPTYAKVSRVREYKWSQSPGSLYICASAYKDDLSLDQTEVARLYGFASLAFIGAIAVLALL